MSVHDIVRALQQKVYNTKLIIINSNIYIHPNIII